MNYKERKIFLLDDEQEILSHVKHTLEKEGFKRIYSANTIYQAKSVIATVQPDLLILDVMLPDGDGFDLLSDIRKTNNCPVIFLTAKDEDVDKLIGLGLGADDYITKPFLTKELILRIIAILKRTYRENTDKSIRFQLGEMTIDLSQALVITKKEEINLTAKERDILLKLYENNGKIVTGDAIANAVWGDDLFGYEQTLMTHIGRIRKKIEENPARPRYLMTIKGIGYKLIVSEES